MNPIARKIDISSIIDGVEADLEKGPLFEISDTPVLDALEGMLVHHSQLGIGIVLRPDKAETLKRNCTKVIFFGYSPAVICNSTSLRAVKLNILRWRKLQRESGLLLEDPNWFAPAAICPENLKEEE